MANFTASSVTSPGEVFATFQITSGADSIHYPISVLYWGADSGSLQSTDTAAPFPVEVISGKGIGVSSVGTVNTVTAVSSVGGSIDISSVSGTVAISSVAGSIGVSSVGTVTTVSTVTAVSSVGGSIAVSSVSGSLAVSSVSGTVAISSVAGSIGVSSVGTVNTVTAVSSVGGVVALSTVQVVETVTTVSAVSSVGGVVAISSVAGTVAISSVAGVVALSTVQVVETVTAVSSVGGTLAISSVAGTVTVAQNSTSGIALRTQSNNGGLVAASQAGSSLAQGFMTSSGMLYGLSLSNPDTDDDVWIKVFPEDSAGVTLGVTEPLINQMVPFGGGREMYWPHGIFMSSGMSIAAAATAPSTAHDTPGGTIYYTAYFDPSSA